MHMDTEAISALSGTGEPTLRSDKCRTGPGVSYLFELMARFKLRHPPAARVV